MLKRVRGSQFAVQRSRRPETGRLYTLGTLNLSHAEAQEGTKSRPLDSGSCFQIPASSA